MTMAIHEALRLLDPTEQTPHDIYAILTYAAAAHPDVAQMMDRFARLRGARVVGEQRQREAPAAIGAEPRLGVPIVPAREPMPRKHRGGRPHGSYTRPKEVISAESAATEANKAASKARRETRHAQKAAESKKKRELAKEKSFTYLVRRAEEELGWTGKYDREMEPKPSWTRAKKKLHWYHKATGVRDNLIWMLKQLLKEMSDSTRLVGTGAVVIEVTYGTKKNALVAMREIINALLVDTSEIGAHLRENWFAAFGNTFKQAVSSLDDEELATLGEDKEWVKDLVALVEVVQEQKHGDETLKDVLSMVAPMAANGEYRDNEECQEPGDESEEPPDEERGSGEDSSEEDDESSDGEETPDKESSEDD